MGRLEGKVAFITGAGAGIARAAADLFSKEGARVALVEINEQTGSAAEKALREHGREALFIRTDIAQEASVVAAVEKAVRAFGKVDVLFNCAGGSIVEDSPVTEVDLHEVWRRTMEVNLLGTMLCCRHAIPHIIGAGGGAVVNMSSGAALRGASPLHVYTAAKGAIVSLTRAMAGSYAKEHVRVNAICAGRIQTGRNVLKYGVDGKGGGTIVDRQPAAERVKDYPFWLGEPLDIANIALFLASDESRMITGAAIPADGGRSSY
ncbi:MAG: oxidoreductase [Betaproteobacteria bacterium RIFCSPLOWO2_12_FULL_63_13]|nr:MAG: oxidoreductase [Betaproteobacteria bacterium RIFCSPLOWO2_12_FULL_63_13]